LTDFFVGPGGSSGNAGTSWAARKLTITQAIALATAAGDNIFVGPGVYRETVTIGSSGGNSYTTGTVSVTNGSAVVTGSGTSWNSNAFAGGVFQLHVLASGTDGVTNGTATFTSAAGNFQAGHIGMTIRIGTKSAYIISAVASATSITLKNPDGSAPAPTAGTALTYNVGPESPYDILSVDSNTQITLTQPWAGPTLTGIAYGTWRPIKIIGDVSGYKTDGVGGVVRITGSDNDTSATRTNCIAVTSKNYITIQGLSLDGSSGNLITLATSTNWIIQDCTWFSCPSTAFSCSGASQANLTIRRCRCMSGGNQVSLTHTATVDNSAHLVENCLLMAGAGNNLLITRVGGVTFRNNTVVSGNSAVSISAALSTGQSIFVSGNLFQMLTTALVATVTSEIIEDYNNFINVSSARSNTGTGANSTAVFALFDSGVLLAGYRLPWQFGALSPYSTLIAKAGFNPPADDFFGLPRPATNAKNSWGPIQFDPIVCDTATKQAGAASLKLPDAGRHPMFVPVTAVSTTISMYVYRESNYAGTNPQMVIRQPGQADITVTDAGSAAGWNQITTTFTPSATSNYVIVEFVSNNTATSGSFAAYYDSLVVS
jgi:hypothetical protein